MRKRAILVGVGSWGEWWCRDFMPPLMQEGRLEIAAVCEKNSERFTVAKRYLGVDDSQCYTDVEKAFSENLADFCIIVVQPWYHEQIVDLALAHGMDILSEKPIADTLEGAVRIAEKVKKAGRKMGVTMSHRFDQDKTALLRELRSGNWGDLDYLIARFTCNLRQFGSWGEMRHRMENPLIMEGAVHHLDILANLAGAPCTEIYAQTWKPEWAEYAGDCNALIQMTFENGVRAFYEGAKSNASTLNGWANEYIRAECREGTLILDQRQLSVYPYNGYTGITAGPAVDRKTIPLPAQPRWANPWLLEQFLDWLDGGPAMETNVEDNLQSMALVSAAIQSSRCGRPVRVQEELEKAMTSLMG